MQSIESDGKWQGAFSGIRFQNKAGLTILEAGKINDSGERLQFYIEDFELEPEERLVGIKSLMKEAETSRHWNL